jgi:hypothetical protein
VYKRQGAPSNLHNSNVKVLSWEREPIWILVELLPEEGELGLENYLFLTFGIR